MKGQSPIELCVVMPAYNEADCIETVVQEWTKILAGKLPAYRLIVVDGGSTDGTVAKLTALAQNLPTLHVITQPNAGYGAALLQGYRAALETDCQWVFQVDSDRQFYTEDFFLLWKERNQANFLLGHRKYRQDRYYRVWTSRFLKRMLHTRFAVDIPDANVPFRLMNRNVLGELLQDIPAQCSIPNIFLSVLAARSEVPMLFVPVRHRTRTTGKSSRPFIRFIAAGKRFLSELSALQLDLPPARPNQSKKTKTA